jgi:RNA polymerase sigma-70 factor (ECF subfamily)
MDAQAFIQGCETALKELVDEMKTPLMKYSYSILLNYADAEDAVQSAFIKAYISRKNIRNPVALSSYLYRLTYNASVDIIRKRRFFVAELQLPNNSSSYMSEEMLIALGKLSVFDRAVVYGRAVDEMSYKELSEIHGKSEQSLRKRYERARTKLFDLLKKEEIEEASMISGKLERRTCHER